MKKLSLILCLVFGLGLAFSGLAQAACGDVGCTPGYWKQSQHLDSWDGYSPDDLFSDVFGVGPAVTLLQALKTGGGGAAALGRHAVAALLNASALYYYRYDESSVIGMVQAAYDSGDFESAKNMFEWENEKGCPLD